MIQGLLPFPFYRWKNWDTKEFGSWSETDPTPYSPGLLSLPGPQASATGLCFRKWMTRFPWSWSPRHTPSSATAARVPGTPSLAPTYIKMPFPESVPKGWMTLPQSAEGKWPSPLHWARSCGLFREVPHAQPPATAGCKAEAAWKHASSALLPWPPRLTSFLPHPCFLGLALPRVKMWAFTSGSAFWGTWTKTVCNGTRKVTVPLTAILQSSHPFFVLLSLDYF